MEQSSVVLRVARCSNYKETSAETWPSSWRSTQCVRVSLSEFTEHKRIQSIPCLDRVHSKDKLGPNSVLSNVEKFCAHKTENARNHKSKRKASRSLKINGRCPASIKCLSCSYRASIPQHTSCCASSVHFPGFCTSPCTDARAEHLYLSPPDLFHACSVTTRHVAKPSIHVDTNSAAIVSLI